LKQKNILFVGHYAGHTGAPIILLRLITWLKENTNLGLKVLLKSDGPLKSLYETIAPVSIYSKPGTESRLKSRLFGIVKNELKKNYPPSSIDLIFTNTITNGEILDALSYLNCPVICRVAELDYWINRSGKANLQMIKKHVTHFIAVSHAVKNNLVQNYDISEKKIDVIHGFIMPEVKKPNPDKIRESLNIPQNSIIVGGCGGEVWRKGKDLFVQLALAVQEKSQIPIYFVWIGGSGKSFEEKQVLDDITKAGLAEYVHIIPEISNPMDYFAAFDIFAMISRDDPYPVANLEAASLGKPILCFENAGGSPEFVEDDAGFVLPYLDINAFAKKITLLSKDRNLREQLGRRASEKVIERHHVTVAGPKLLKVIQRLVSE